MAKKKFVTPEDNQTVSIPEDNPETVRIRKTKTNSFSPIGRFYKGCVYDVSFAIYEEFRRLDECDFVEVIK